MDDVAIKAENLSKDFRLPHEKTTTIKSAVVSFWGRDRGFEMQHALKDVTFEIKKGEFFGIVGHNGSGKSTLLKLLANIYTPTKGSVQVNGKLTPFIELGVGFNPELTGRENVFLNGALLGFGRKEMEKKYADIVQFSELERFMDQKLKNYSSGMQVRLAFSIAIQSESDIYLFDEVLAVGDYQFQQKCLEYFKYLKSIRKTVILVSHDTNSLQMFCTGGLLLNHGKITSMGTIKDVLADYAAINSESNFAANAHPGPSKKLETTDEISLVKVLSKSNSKKQDTFNPQDTVKVIYRILPHIDIESPVIGFVVQDASGQPIFATNTLDAKIKTPNLTAGKEAVVEIELKNIFNDGRYYISGAIASSDRTKTYLRFLNAHSFRSLGWENTAKGLVYLPYKLNVKNKS